MDLKPVATIKSEEGNAVVSVTFPFAEVDRIEGMGWIVDPKNKKLIKRLMTAIEAGVVYTNLKIKKDVYNKTYVSGEIQVGGRKLNADLKRLGF